MLTEMFYRYDIDVEHDDGINFDDLLKELVLVRCKKRLADLFK